MAFEQLGLCQTALASGVEDAMLCVWGTVTDVCRKVSPGWWLGVNHQEPAFLVCHGLPESEPDIESLWNLALKVLFTAGVYVGLVADRPGGCWKNCGLSLFHCFSPDYATGSSTSHELTFVLQILDNVPAVWGFQKSVSMTEVAFCLTWFPESCPLSQLLHSWMYYEDSNEL